MKIRQGFVSNSSSSSFIVAFSKMPENEDELRKLMFGDAIYHSGIYDDGRYTTMEIARRVWNTMQSKAEREEYYGICDGEIEYDDILPVMDEGWTDGCPDYPDRFWRLKYGTPEYEKAHAEYEALTQKHNESLRDAKFKPSGRFFKFTYGDDNQFGSMMEHSGIFNRLRHVRISKH